MGNAATLPKRAQFTEMGGMLAMGIHSFDVPEVGFAPDLGVSDFEWGRRRGQYDGSVRPWLRRGKHLASCPPSTLSDRPTPSISTAARMPQPIRMLLTEIPTTECRIDCNHSTRIGNGYSATADGGSGLELQRSRLASVCSAKKKARHRFPVPRQVFLPLAGKKKLFWIKRLRRTASRRACRLRQQRRSQRKCSSRPWTWTG